MVLGIAQPGQRNGPAPVSQADGHDLEVIGQGRFIHQQHHQSLAANDLAQHPVRQAAAAGLPVHVRVGDKALQAPLRGVGLARPPQRFGHPGQGAGAGQCHAHAKEGQQAGLGFAERGKRGGDGVVPVVECLGRKHKLPPWLRLILQFNLEAVLFPSTTYLAYALIENCRALSPGPGRRRKKRQILRQIRALPAQTTLLAQDETDLLLFPPLCAGWARRGQAATVLISGYNARRTMFATLDLRTGRMLCLDQERKRTEEFLEFLDFIRWHYRAGPVALLLDENSIHTAEESQSLAQDLDIRLLWLPCRSLQLNPLDHLWGFGKGAVCANWQQSSIEIQVFQFIDYYRTLTKMEMLRKAGMLSPNFWLYRV